MANANLKNAKKQKNDEFYTQYQDIQKEVNAYLEYDKDVFRGKTILLPCDDPEWSNFTKFFAQNFENFGIKKLISTSFAVESKNMDIDYEPTLFESIDPRFDKAKTRCKGKIFTLTQDENHDGKINIDSLVQHGDGEGNGVPLIILTGMTREKDMMDAIAKLEALDCSLDKVRMLRIENI